MKLGKFPPELLERLLAKIPVGDERVLLGPRIGEDAALLDMGARVLVAKADPVTLATDLIGWYAVHVNANDVACSGATPRWFLATLLVPEGFAEGEAEKVFDQLLEACASLNVTLVGGHSEVTAGLDRPIIAGCMLGEADAGKYVTTGGARPGDSIVVTKGIALEGTAILARDSAKALAEAGVDSRTAERSKALLFSPGISVVRDALIACATVEVHSLHDPTEGGLATGLWEVARAAGVGLAVEEGSIPILPECVEICQALELDPLGLLASGALLITLPPENVPKLVSTLEKEGIDAYEIGHVTDPEEGVHIISASSHELVPLPTFERDELARWFASRGRV
jgi:hydrogenase maturation factor